MPADVRSAIRNRPLFVSYFPLPKPFFLSAVGWSLFLVVVWFLGGEQLGAVLGMPPVDPAAPPVISPLRFLTPSFIWFYIYFAAGIGLLTGLLAYPFVGGKK